LARKNAQVIDWFDDPSLREVPNPKSPGVFTLARKQKWFHRAVIADIVVAPLILLLILFSVIGGSKGSTTGATNPNPLINPGVYQGQVAIQQWLNSKPSPLPGGHIVSFYNTVPIHAPSTATPPVANDEIVNYIVLANGTFYKVSVEAQLTGSSASIISDPYLSVTANSTTVPGSTPTISSPWPGISPTPVPSSGPLQQSVQGWANALTSGSSSSLALSIGDPNQGDHYVPLHGVSQVASTIEFYAPTNKTGTKAIAEVNLAITWNGEKPTTNSNYTFDILIERPLSAAPVVVAWGPPGSGPSLTPYQNATS
jgi:hypothetical protein